MLGGIMGMMGGGGPMGMINKLMQSVQQMQSQQGGEFGQCSEGGGKNDPARDVPADPAAAHAAAGLIRTNHVI